MPLISDPANNLLRAGFDLVENTSVALKPEAPNDEGDQGVRRLTLDCLRPPVRERSSRGRERGAQFGVGISPYHLGEGTVQGEMVECLIMNSA